VLSKIIANIINIKNINTAILFLGYVSKIRIVSAIDDIIEDKLTIILLAHILSFNIRAEKLTQVKINRKPALAITAIEFKFIVFANNIDINHTIITQR